MYPRTLLTFTADTAGKTGGTGGGVGIGGGGLYLGEGSEDLLAADIRSKTFFGTYPTSPTNVRR